MSFPVEIATFVMKSGDDVAADLRSYNVPSMVSDRDRARFPVRKDREAAVASAADRLAKALAICEAATAELNR